MENYKNADGNPIASDGREIRSGDTLKVIACDMAFMLAVYSDNGILTAKNDTVQAYVETICRCSDKVEITNR